MLPADTFIDSANARCLIKIYSNLICNIKNENKESYFMHLTVEPNKKNIKNREFMLQHPLIIFM